MILAIDIGNTNIKVGVFDGDDLIHSLRLSASKMRTGDEYGFDILSQLNISGITIEKIDGAIISSVNPNLNYTFDHVCEYYFKVKPLMVGSGVKTGLNIKYDNPKEVGADRIVNSVAAYHLYNAPCIIMDCGTATTFNVINEKCEFVGGVIGIGLKTAVEALSVSAAKLPRIELVMPSKVVGKNTITNMQSGVLNGYIGMVEHIIEKIKDETGYANVQVIATGGLAEIIKKNSKVIDVLDRTLTLHGLNIIYKINIEKESKQ